ncbi:MAG: PQQ-binding-like beta-propeller repeat protein [Thermoplasmata archaeon]|nr:PQQ-binding-like beta-propeller repeat protein [Thermoplasmata archaeon]
MPSDPRSFGVPSHPATVRSSDARRTILLSVALALLFLVPAVPTGSASAHPSLSVRPSVSSVLVAPGVDFPTFLGNIERTSSSSERFVGPSNASSLHPLWNFYAGGEGLQSQPVEQNGITYVGGRTGYEYALDAINGTVLWQTYLGQDSNDSGCYGGLGVTSTATVAGADLYVDGGSPYLYDLNSTTGAIEWRALIGGSDNSGYYDWSSPLIYDGSAYIGVSSDCDQPLVGAGLAEYSLSTHALVASFNSSVPELNGSSIWGSPSIDTATNTIFVTTGNAYTGYQSNYSESVIALNASTLAVRATWQLPPQAVTVDGDFGVTPTLFTPSSGVPMVTAANKNGVLYAFDQSNLTLVWNRTICCQNHTQIEHISTAWGGGYVYAVGALTTIGSVVYNSSVWEIDPLTGATMWVRGFSQTSEDGYAAPLWVNQLLIVPDQGTLLVLNANNGATLYQDTVPGTFEAPASVSRGEIFAASDNAHVYAFDLALNSSASQSRPVGAAPLTDSFGVTPSGGIPPYSYAWTFGDGQASNLSHPSHTYAAVGSYNVTVSVQDLAGNVSVSRLVVTVKPGVDVTFGSAGIPPGTNWSVTLDGAVLSSTGADILFVEPNGSYPYEVVSLPGYSASPSSGTVNVSGVPLLVAIDFSNLSKYAVTFTETGLSAGSNWSVTINGSEHWSTTTTILVDLGDGVYAFSVGSVTKWAASPGDGIVTVEGGSVHQSISFSTVSTCQPNCGGPPIQGWTLSDDVGYLLLGVLVLVGVSVMLWSRRRRKAPPTLDGAVSPSGTGLGPPPP